MKLEGRDHTLAVKPDNLDPESLDPRKLRFGLGDRVACNCSNEGWERGKVVQLLYSEMGSVHPYQVLLDNGRYIFAPADDDDLIRRPSDAPVEDKSWRLTGLRFDKGRLVDCAFGEGDDDWVTGTVVLTSYREGGLVFPYQIETQDGYLIAAPEDDDGCIRSSDNYRFQVGTRVECIVEEGWLPGTVTGVDVVRSSPDYTHKVYSPYE